MYFLVIPQQKQIFQKDGILVQHVIKESGKHHDGYGYRHHGINPFLENEHAASGHHDHREHQQSGDPRNESKRVIRVASESDEQLLGKIHFVRPPFPVVRFISFHYTEKRKKYQEILPFARILFGDFYPT